MPAALRGAGRSSAKPRGKSPASPARSRSAQSPPPQQAGAAGAAHRFGLTPAIAAGAAGAVLVFGLVVALATGHRAEVLAASGESAVADQLGAAGFRVNSVHLQGASQQASADILAAVGVRRGQPVFGVDLEALRQRVEHVVWVKNARVIRLLPDTLVVVVQERHLLAVWQHDGHASVIDKDGAVAVEADPARFAGLPLVVGQGANLAAAGILPSVTSRPQLMQRLEALVRVDDRRWDLRLKDGSIIQLPASDEEAALIRLDELDRRSQILELGFSRIDLRDPEMVAVRPRETQATSGSVDGVG
ncbi:MAG: cell division protein FtsQ/DivIB [Caulobacterales bacterium]